MWKFGVVVGSVTLTGAGAYVVLQSHWYAERKSALTSKLLGLDDARTTEMRELRTLFRESIVPRSHVGVSLHAGAAAARAEAESFMTLFCAKAGRPIHDYQSSRREALHAETRHREYYWARDLTVPGAADSAAPDAVVTMVDVDYYVDMPKFLASRPQPHLLYTFLPSAAAYSDSEYAYTWEDNELHVDYNGGDKLVHRVWDWTNSHVVTSSWRIPLPWSITTIWQCDVRRVSHDHALVLLTPAVRVDGLFAWLYLWWRGLVPPATGAASGRLNRMNPCAEGWTHVRSVGADGVKHSYAPQGSYASVELDERTVHILRAYRTDGWDVATKPTLTTFKNALRGAGHRTGTLDLEAAYAKRIPISLLGRGDCPVVPREVQPQHVMRYQYGEYDPEAKCAVVAFMSPLVSGAFAPDKTPGNGERAVRERVVRLAEAAARHVPTASMAQRAAEYARAVADRLIQANAGHLHPVSDEEVSANQPRPSQQRILAEAAVGEGNGEHRTVSFMKAESYPEVKDPRVISQIDGHTKAEWSRYVMAMSAAIKSFPWYAFGKPPREIAERVAHICNRSRELGIDVAVGDYSRYDGTLTQLLRDIGLAVGMRAFAPEHRGEYARLNRLMRNRKGRMGETTYDTLQSRMSGEAATSLENTIIEPFPTFVALRRQGLTVAAAMDYLDDLWLAGGDDGLGGASEATQAAIPEAASGAGLKLKLQVYKVGEPGVNFLSRFYGPHVWEGDPNSMCDVPRQLRKLHTTPCLPASVTPETRLVEKARSFYVCDRNTPVIGPFVAAVIAAHGEPWDPTVNPYGIRRWETQCELEDQYPNDVGEWARPMAEAMLDEAGIHIDVSVQFEFDNLADALNVQPLCEEVADVPPDTPAVVDADSVSHVPEDPVTTTTVPAPQPAAAKATPKPQAAKASAPKAAAKACAPKAAGKSQAQTPAPRSARSKRAARGHKK